MRYRRIKFRREDEQMTNRDIIAMEKAELYKNGILKAIKTTQIEVIKNGEKVIQDVPIIEPIHTYQGWKERGYQVRKGEKSNIRITIWKHTAAKTTKEGKKIPEKTFLKNSAFFTADQVDKIQ